jgi:Tol biopolymer transport system component
MKRGREPGEPLRPHGRTCMVGARMNGSDVCRRKKRRAAFGAGVVLVVTCWACTGLTPGPPSNRTTSRTATPPMIGDGVQATLPEDLATRELAFTLEDGVYVGNADGTGIRRITDIPGFEYQPNWSSDGTKLLLRVDDESGQSGGVWSVNADGSDPVDLTRRAGVAGGTPDWSPDATRIAFVGAAPGEERAGIYVMNADGSAPERLTNKRYEAQCPDWSPDGSKIAFTIVENGGFDIFVMNPDGSQIRRLTDTPGEDNWPEWSPDGTQIVYSYENDLWVMNADGTGAHLLAEDAGEPSWSPDGRWIAFDCASTADDEGGMCAIRPDGTGRTAILGTKGGFPAWRP